MTTTHSPAQLRQLAATRFIASNRQEWCDKVVEALRDAAAQLERYESERLTWANYDAEDDGR